MKFVSYLKENHDQLAALIDGRLFDMERLHPELPNTMGLFLQYWDDFFPMALGGEMMVREGTIHQQDGTNPAGVDLLAPVPFPSSLRNGYAFRQHVAAARRNRNAEMIAEFDQYPVFYFGNHHSVRGPGEIVCMPDHFDKLDFELEVAVVIGRQGKNIAAAEADNYIAGLMIMNDFSARTLQADEMLLQLGPAKGKDFATATGPWLVTLEELQEKETAAKPGHIGKSWNLRMQCRVNGEPVSDGRLSDMDWTFAELIERASYGVDLYPGDIIGSGTVGTGCFLEPNGTAKRNDASHPAVWLQEGDVVELEVDALGLLSNTIVKDETELSLLALKKNI